jgi:hypothetical protein
MKVTLLNPPNLPIHLVPPGHQSHQNHRNLQNLLPLHHQPPLILQEMVSPNKKEDDLRSKIKISLSLKSGLKIGRNVIMSCSRI